MLTRILHPSEKLCTFVDQLDLDLSQPQRRHLIHLADGLLVCEDEKTLAALQRQFVTAPDASNMADFLRISPWNVHDTRAALRRHQVRWLVAAAERSGAPRVLYINIDDSLAAKDPGTRHLEPVDWHYDHSESTRTRPRFKNALCYVVCTLRAGSSVATVDLQLYLREKTVRRHNRQRPPGQRLPFRSKYRIARQMLVELAPLMPQGWQIYVQFDSWYASRRLIKFVRRQGWHVTCGLKRNRRLSGTRLDAHAQALKHRWYTRVRVTTADGDPQTYYVRRLEGRLAEVPYDVRVFFSKRHPRESSPAYIGCTDLACSAKQALQRLHLALVVRDGQLLPQDAVGLGRLSGPVLRGGGQVCRRRAPGVGPHRVSSRPRAVSPGAHLRRHRAAASGRARHRLADRSLTDGSRDRRPRGGPSTLFCTSTLCRDPNLSC
jgi:hypothetical protein